MLMTRSSSNLRQHIETPSLSPACLECYTTYRTLHHAARGSVAATKQLALCVQKLRCCPAACILVAVAGKLLLLGRAVATKVVP